ncbi:uncharacterized protein LOC141803878 [Halichoeres trimaculatus]|uniref:uncharacterized protein LOC141803878 n=1 Tax=Halichoeres trimaculatus TaxID=147232 RepID=UPI003D9E2D15
MENSSFHSQLLSVMDILAKAAGAEINRRVDDCCAVLRLEVSQSRRDIDLLRRKCEVMEAELRRSRIRARRRVFYPPAADRFSPLVRVAVNKETRSLDWDRQNESEAENQPQQVLQCADMEPAAAEAEHILIKVECAEEEMWKNHPGDKTNSEAVRPPCFQASHPTPTEDFEQLHHSAENRDDSGSQMSPTSDYNTFQDQQLSTDQNETELRVKHETEEEQDESGDPLVSEENFVTGDGNGQLWRSDQWTDAADTSSSYAGQQLSSVFPSQSGLNLEHIVPQIQALEESQSAALSAARVKRRNRMFGSRRPQHEGYDASTQFSHCSIAELPQHPYPDSLPHTGHQNEDLTPNASAHTSSLVPSRNGVVMSRRMRTPWRSVFKEKKFSCTYCLKTFLKHCQLKEHLRSHTGERPYSCKLCGRSFAKQCNLIRHAVVHSGEKPHECSLCGKCFTQRSSLKSHQKTAH